jgi:hypothetical protein
MQSVLSQARNLMAKAKAKVKKADVLELTALAGGSHKIGDYLYSFTAGEVVTIQARHFKQMQSLSIFSKGV